MTAWIDVVGIGEDGLQGLSAEAVKALEVADVVIGGDRHHRIAPGLSAERVRWPSPFSKMIGTIAGYRGQKVALLVTGDPLWFSAGAKIVAGFPAAEIRFHPQLSAFQLACARMRWSLADIDTLTIHGRPAEQIIPWFAPGARLAVLTGGSDDPGAVARMLADRGYGPSRLTVLAELGGTGESMLSALASDWARQDPASKVPGFHTLCIECRVEPGIIVLPRGPGLPDDAFLTDGNFTKSDVRAATICALGPRRGELLWDIGCGCGTVAVEWMRCARDARAIGVDPDRARREMARENARILGTPGLELVPGRAPAALTDLPDPNAIFIGGGLDRDVVETALARLRPAGRIVANAVTLESNSLLADIHRQAGGQLVRLSVEIVSPLGNYRGWQPIMPVTQWRYCR